MQLRNAPRPRHRGQDRAGTRHRWPARRARGSSPSLRRARRVRIGGCATCRCGTTGRTSNRTTSTRSAPSAIREPVDRVVSDAAERRGRGSERRSSARVCGCMLGKPFEIDIALDEIRAALEPTGEWPLSDYPTEASAPRAADARRASGASSRASASTTSPPTTTSTTRSSRCSLLEQHGARLHARRPAQRCGCTTCPSWRRSGPERTILLASACDARRRRRDRRRWTSVLNPGDELCGALIRADAYGYACLGRSRARGRARAARRVAHAPAHRHLRRDVRRRRDRDRRRSSTTRSTSSATALALRPAAQPVRRARRATRSRSSSAASDWLDGYERDPRALRRVRLLPHLPGGRHAA